MRAVVFEHWKTFPTLKDVPRPTPGPGEVLLKVAGAGACHSDLALIHDYDESTGRAQVKPPYVLGHESSGWLEQVGEGVNGPKIGEAFLVYGPIGCGQCAPCSRGQATYCEHVSTMPCLASGLGRDGGMAEFMTVPAHNLVPLGDADPFRAAPLADAGLTPYHAIKLSLPKLAGGGKTALVIGLGGLGLVAVQILAAITGATVFATDTKPEAMARAQDFGAIAVPGGPDQVENIRKWTRDEGVTAVFDFVGVASTISLAAATVARQGRITVVGGAGGAFDWSFRKLPYEVELTTTYWGTIEELHEVVALYRAGKVVPDVEYFALDDALEAYRKLESGAIAGRAVITPHGR